MSDNTNSTEKNLNIKATPVEGENFVHLEWSNLGEGYNYMAYSKGQDEEIYQSIPSKGNVKVLNIYPGEGNNLKGWMEDPNSESANGYGKGLISVDEVDIDAFNSNPTLYMKDANGNWKYDVVYFGAWDSNNNKDLDPTSVSVVTSFIESGYGVLFGHDTICSSFNPNFMTFSTYLNMDIDSSYWEGKLEHGDGTTVKITKKGLITNYPWNIGDVGTILTIPYAHTVGQLPHGDIWMKFTNAESSPADSYLTTWNNVAQIMTGHSNGAATPDEQKVLANTLFYLAQLTSDTSCDDHKGQDLTAPDKVVITNVSTDGEKLNIAYSKPNDNGTEYEYYVKAINGHDDNEIISNTASTVNTSGLSGYSYVIDNVEDIEPDNKIDTTDLSITMPLSGLDVLKPIYVHIKAIDNVGNAAEVTHYKYIYVSSLELDKKEITLEECSSEQLTAVTDPKGIGLIWTSSDASVATVDENGKVTAVKEGKATITVTTVNGSNLSEECIVTVIPRPIILNIEPGKSNIHLNGNVVVNYTIDNIKDIAAEDAIIEYDNTRLKFLGMDEAKGIKLVKIENNDGELRVITASEGLSSVANDKRILLKLYFQGIATGEALVDITKGKVSDGIEMEKELKNYECGQGIIIIDEMEMLDDVNRSGEFTLLDLAIDARHLGEDPKTLLPEYETDQVINGAIDNDDLLKIGEYMIANRNYKFM